MIAFADADFLISTGRLLIGGLYVLGGVTHFFILPIVVRQMSDRRVPFPTFALIAGSVFEIVAGLAIMLDRLVPWAAGALVVFTIVSSCMMMDFWNMAGEKRIAAIDGWTSNIGVIGGLLILAAHA